MELNKDDIYICDLFHLNYFGVNVFFVVCNTRYDEVCLYEVKTKIKKINGEWVEIVNKKLAHSETPYIIPRQENTLTKSKYWVSPIRLPFEDEISLPIKVDISSRLYEKALQLENQYPLSGIAYAKQVKDFQDKCWEHNKEKNNFYKKELIC